MSVKIPVIVIGGYLGAGKTTLLNHVLRHADGRRIAILVNEFGDLPIDADLIEAEDDEIIAITGGCICCSFGSDMTAALMSLAGLSPKPDYVVIEASGVAMPGTVGASITLLDEFILSGIVVLADAERITIQANDGYLADTILRQLFDADLIVQTKIDLIEPQAAKDNCQWIATHNSRAPIIPASQGKVPLEVILGIQRTTLDLQLSGHSDAEFTSKVFGNIAACDPHILAKNLAIGGFGVIRAKGFIESLTGQTYLIQIVADRYDVREFERPEPPAIVCIGLSSQLDVKKIAQEIARAI